MRLASSVAAAAFSFLMGDALIAQTKDLEITKFKAQIKSTRICVIDNSKRLALISSESADIVSIAVIQRCYGGIEAMKHYLKVAFPELSLNDQNEQLSPLLIALKELAISQIVEARAANRTR